MNIWTVKLVLAAVITVCCAFAGRALCMKERRRVELLNGLIKAMPVLRLYMLERLEPLEAALGETHNILLLHVRESMARGMSAREAWSSEAAELTKQGAMLDSLVADDIARLDILFGELGASGLSAQRLLLDSCEQGLSVLLKEAKARADDRAKLYTNLGLLTGLAISICLL